MSSTRGECAADAAVAIEHEEDAAKREDGAAATTGAEDDIAIKERADGRRSIKDEEVDDATEADTTDDDDANKGTEECDTEEKTDGIRAETAGETVAKGARERWDARGGATRYADVDA